MSKPDPPQPPDPIRTAAGATATNVGTAVANAFMNNINQITPQGELRYDATGTYNWSDPTTGSTYNIPTFTATQLLSPTEQNIQGLGNTTQTNLAGLAANQSGMLQNLLGSPVNIGGAPGGGITNYLEDNPQPWTSFANVGGQQRSLSNEDYSADRARVEEGLYQRMQPQLERDRGQMEARLADQGIKIGSPAYQAAMDQFDRKLTDARLGIIQAGAAEQQQAFNQLQQRGAFANQAQTQDFQQAALRGNFYNTAAQQMMARDQQLVDAQNKQRQTWLQEQYAQRNQPINEITALMSGSQVQNPQFVNTPSSNIATTDYAGLINNRFSQDMSNYTQQNQNFQNLMGGIFGAMSGVIKSDRREKENIDKIGTVFAAGPDGEKPLPVYEYSYKDDPRETRRVGPMAQDVEKIDKKAVMTRKGTKYIDMTRLGSILKVA